MGQDEVTKNSKTNIEIGLASAARLSAEDWRFAIGATLEHFSYGNGLLTDVIERPGLLPRFQIQFLDQSKPPRILPISGLQVFTRFAIPAQAHQHFTDRATMRTDERRKRRLEQEIQLLTLERSRRVDRLQAAARRDASPEDLAQLDREAPG